MSSRGAAGPVPLAAEGAAGERWLLFGLTAAWALVVVNNLMVGPLLVELSRDFGMSVPEVAVVVSAYGLTAGVAALAAGPLLDRFGRIELALGGLAVLGGSAAIAALASGLGMLLVARVAAGVGVAFLQPGVFALVGDAIPYHRRGRAMGLVMNGSSFASLAGVPAVTFAAGTWGWRSAFGLALGLGAITGMLMLAGLRAVPGRGTRAEATGSLGVGATYRLVLANPSAVWAVIVNFLGSAYWFGWLTYLAAFFVYRFELSTVAVAPLISATGIGMLAGVNLGGRFGDVVGHRRLTAYAHVVSAVMLALLTTMVPSLWLAAATVVVLAIPTGARFATQNTLLSALVPGARGTSMALGAAAIQFGLLVGASLGGAIVASAGYTAIGPACASLALVAAAILWWLVKDPVRS